MTATLIKIPLTFLDEAVEIALGDWAEGNVVLTRELAGKGAGPFRARYWQAEIFDVIDRRLTRRLSLLLYSRAGKSIIINIVLGKNVSVDKLSSMFVLPSREMLKDYNRQKLEPFLDTCPSANAVVKRNKNNELSEFGVAYSGGAGEIHYRTGRVAGGLKQLTAEIAIADEVDDCDVSSVDGSYADLLLQRGADAINPIFIEAGTPTVRGGSAIEYAVIEKSDFRELWFPHDACGDITRFDLEQAAKVDGVWLMHCAKCGEAIPELERQTMLPRGRWIPNRPEISETHRGYHLNMFASPDHTVDEIMSTWDPEKITGFYTQKLARTPPDVDLRTPEYDEFRELQREPTEGNPFLVTAGVDVQTGAANRRLECSVLEYRGDRYDPDRYVRRHITVAVAEDRWVQGFRDLRRILDAMTWRPDFIFVDAGGNLVSNSETIKEALARVWPRTYLTDRVVAIKGMAIGSDKWADQAVIYREYTWGDRTDVRATLPIYTDIVKYRFWEDDGIFQRGRIRFSPDLDRDYFDELTAERLQRHVRRRGNVETEMKIWRKVTRGAKVERLDCLVYAEGAFLFAGFDYQRAPTLRAPTDEQLRNLLGT